MRKSGIIFAVLFACLAISFSVAYWPNIKRKFFSAEVDRAQEARDIQSAKELLKEAKPEEAIKIIVKYAPEIEHFTSTGKEWQELFVEASEKTRDIPQLVILYEHDPKSFLNHEEASIMVGDALIATSKGKMYATLRDTFKGREKIPESWFALDVDKLLLDGKQKDALTMLKSKTFEGPKDTGRLIRLALLSLNDDPKQSWDYLTEAVQKDPQNPLVRTYRAKLLETVGKNSLALTEYQAAVAVAPQNLYLRDQLAEFYLRHKQFNYALQVWADALKEPSLDYLWIKAIFWNRVVTPIKFDWSSVEVPEGKLKPLVNYLLGLKPDQFWDADSFEKIPSSSKFLKSEQATYWLRLLQMLKNGDEKGASELLEFNPFYAVSWNPELETTLQRILKYRNSGTLNIEADQDIATQTATGNSHNKPIVEENAFFTQIATFAKPAEHGKKVEKIPSDLHDLLLSKEVFAATFLSTGWFDAALKLNTMRIIPDNFPDWVAFGFIQAIRVNKDPIEALKFANLQKPSPTLDLLIGELLVASGSHEAGLEKLKLIYKEDNDIGYRASWLVSLIYIEQKKYEEAKEAIDAQPRLAQAILGQETLARIALLRGDEETADKIYNSISSKSAEAKSYLARKAFAEKNWKTAHELTEELLGEYPNNELLLENMKKILEEEKNAAKTK
jgi:hypothetical protein